MRRAALVAFATLALLAAAAGPASSGGGATAVPSGDGGVASLSDAGLAPQVTTTANGTPVRHVDPDETESVDYGRIEGWLSVALSGRLSESTGELDRGDYERARALLGDDVDRYLAQYEDVAGETSGGADDRLARAFADAARDQRAFAEGVDDFERTMAEYREARRAGEEAEARRLARDLLDQATGIDRTGDALAEDYAAIEDGTGRDFSAEMATVDDVAANVTTTGEAVAEESFVATEVRIASASGRAAFDDPLDVEGRLVAEDGSAVGGGAVRLVVGNRTLATARPAANGSFALSGRPTLVGTGNRPVEVRFVPAADSVYLGSTGTATTRIEAVEPTVELSVVPGTARYDDSLVASGRVIVNGTGVPGLPVALSIGGTEQIRVETDADGDFAGSFRLPADVLPGERPLDASLPTDGLAVAPASANAPVEVGVRSTDLRLSAERTDPDAAQVTGSLVAEGERPVEGQPIAVLVDDEPVATARTDASGAFAVEVPVAGDGDDSVPVAVRFDGDGTNLGPANASATVPPAASGGETTPAPSPPLAWLLGGAIGLLLVAGGGYATLRWRRRSGDDEVAPASGVVAQEAAEGPSAPASGLVERARGHVEAGRPDLAVRVAYAAARDRLGREVEGQAANTHWEFYRACADRLDDEEADALRSLTEAFERAAFSRTGTDRGTATRAIEAAGRLVEGG